MNFECYGPFELDWYKLVEQWQKLFWDSVDEQLSFNGLSTAMGIYIFCLKHGEKITPYYVGKTVNKKGFKGEVFTDHKYAIYENLIENEKIRHKPCFMFFPLMTDESWNFSNNRSHGAKAIDWLETTLISMAYAVNNDLKNDKKTSYAKHMYVNGIIGDQNTGRRSNSARIAAKMFKTKKQ